MMSLPGFRICMNRKSKTAYVCNSCGQDYWAGAVNAIRCWDTIAEIRSPQAAVQAGKSGVTFQPQLLSECKSTDTARVKSKRN